MNAIEKKFKKFKRTFIQIGKLLPCFSSLSPNKRGKVTKHEK